MVAAEGVAPTLLTYRVSTLLLSYAALVEAVGIEPTSLWLRARCIAILPCLQDERHREWVHVAHRNLIVQLVSSLLFLHHMRFHPQAVSIMKLFFAKPNLVRDVSNITRRLVAPAVRCNWNPCQDLNLEPISP